MLTADLVNARRYKGELRLVRTDEKNRDRALELAESFLAVIQAHVGRPREEVEDALGLITVAASERRLADGLRKLADDQCTFEATSAIDPESLRREVFMKATAAR